MIWVILFFLIGNGIAAAEDNQEATQLEQRYDRESDNPRRQAGIAVDLTKSRFEQLREAYDAGDAEQQKVAIDAYQSALERLEASVTAARHVGTSKKTEVFLRRHGRDLENLKLNVSYFVRPDIEKLSDRAAEVRQEILYSIMNPEKD